MSGPEVPWNLSDALGDDPAEDVLHVNDAFAKRFDREGARREAQRLVDLTASDPLTDEAVHVLMRCAKKTLKLVAVKLARMTRRGAASPSSNFDAQIAALNVTGILTPAVVAGEALRRASFVCTQTAQSLLETNNFSDSAILDALDRVVKHSQMQKQLTSLATWARKNLHAGPKVAATIAGVPISLDPSVVELKRRRNSVEKESEVAPLKIKAPSALHVLAKVEPVAVHSGKLIVIESAPLVAHKDRVVAVGYSLEAMPDAFHIHGRGAGYGRGLTDAGEPYFDELHPSWQAKRRVTRKHVKTVSKSLRASNSGADVIVVVPSGQADSCSTTV